jgi:hypothetical protein
MQRF